MTPIEIVFGMRYVEPRGSSIKLSATSLAYSQTQFYQNSFPGLYDHLIVAQADWGLLLDFIEKTYRAQLSEYARLYDRNKAAFKIVDRTFTPDGTVHFTVETGHFQLIDNMGELGSKATFLTQP
jgi:phage regulator Rha-like protein